MNWSLETLWDSVAQFHYFPQLCPKVLKWKPSVVGYVAHENVLSDGCLNKLRKYRWKCVYDYLYPFMWIFRVNVSWLHHSSVVCKIQRCSNRRRWHLKFITSDISESRTRNRLQKGTNPLPHLHCTSFMFTSHLLICVYIQIHVISPMLVYPYFLGWHGSSPLNTRSKQKQDESKILLLCADITLYGALDWTTSPVMQNSLNVGSITFIKRERYCMVILVFRCPRHSVNDSKSSLRVVLNKTLRSRCYKRSNVNACALSGCLFWKQSQGLVERDDVVAYPLYHELRWRWEQNLTSSKLMSDSLSLLNLNK